MASALNLSVEILSFRFSVPPMSSIAQMISLG